MRGTWEWACHMTTIPLERPFVIEASCRIVRTTTAGFARRQTDFNCVHPARNEKRRIVTNHIKWLGTLKWLELSPMNRRPSTLHVERADDNIC